MKIGGNYSEPGSLVPIERTWRVEKPAASSNLRDDSRRHSARALTNVKSATTLNTTRCGTRVIDSEHLLLQPAFVAQVLGQIMNAGANDPISATRAYTIYSRRVHNPEFAETA
jgi:hypothetical protein